MAISTEIPLTGQWQAIATAGWVMFTANVEVTWAITGSTSPPSFSGGHKTLAGEDEERTLTGSERLWVRSLVARGVVYVTADAPV